MTVTEAGTRRRAERDVRARHRARPRSRSMVAWIVAVALVGALCAAVAVFDVRLRWLETGSMVPTYPADAVVLSYRVPATDVRLGDVVTVPQSGGSDVTHRVTRIQTIAGGVSLTLKGDANVHEDRSTYDVTAVDRVIAGVPGGGSVVEWLGSPGVLPVAASVCVLVIVWAIWPRRATHTVQRRGGGRRVAVPSGF